MNNKRKSNTPGAFGGPPRRKDIQKRIQKWTRGYLSGRLSTLDYPKYKKWKEYVDYLPY